jgi:hypothetical protein
MSSTFELRMLPSADICMSSFPGLLHGRYVVAAHKHQWQSPFASPCQASYV